MPPDGGPSWREFEGIKVSQDPQTIRDFPEVRRVPSEDAPGWSRDPLRVHQGANSGHQAGNLAMHLIGRGRVVLLGFDMKLGPNGERHWHGDHPSGLNNPSQGKFELWRDAFTPAPEGIEIVNCTPGSALDCYPMMDLEDALG